VAHAPWSDEDILQAVRQYVLPSMQKQGGMVAWVVDDTGVVKKGTHSVGVARQYCGQVGKQENCRVAVSLSLSAAAASLPIAWRLCLPEVWAEDKRRRKATGVPSEIRFQTKAEIALEQIRSAVQREIPAAPVLADAGYGNDTAFRDGISELGLLYVVGIQSSVTVWPPGEAPLPKRKWKGIGRSCFAAMVSTLRCQCARRPSAYLPRTGRWCIGAKEAVSRCVPVLPFCAYVRPIGINGTANPIRKTGCSSSGRSKNQNPPSTGSPLFPPTPRFPISCAWPNIAGSSNETTRS
jgi:hypothetical protein